jgi:tuberous sclerosis protein 2
VFNKPADQRHLVLNFYGKLIQGQYKELSIMRAHFFRLIENHEIPEDITIRLELLNKLTENGKDIQNLETEIPKFMIKWIPQICEAKLMAAYLEIFVNLIKYNTAYVDKGIIIAIVHHASVWCLDKDDNTVFQSLYLLEAVIGYAQIPDEILGNCIIALCRTVKEKYIQESYKIMKKLLSTQLGFASLLIMCSMLKDRRYYTDPEMLQGAVFHIRMGLWGSPSNPMLAGLKYSSTVLLSYAHVLSCDHISVNYEVILSIQNLIERYGSELGEPSWDIIIDILTQVLNTLDKLRVPEQNIVRNTYHAVLTSIEELIQKQQINADLDQVYSIIERVAEHRSVSSFLINLKIIQFLISNKFSRRNL